MSNVIIPDISHYETVTDWKKLAENTPFLIMKATQGVDKVDKKLKSTIEGCQKYNIPYWVYVYLEDGDVDYQKTQIDFLIKTMKDFGVLGNADLISDKYFIGYVLDIEAGQSLKSASAALAYLMAISGPYKIMVYTGYKDYNKYKKLIDMVKSTNGTYICWWESRYGKNNGKWIPLYPPHKGCDFHQYTDKGTFPGIKGEVDLNRLTGTKTISWFTKREPVIVSTVKVTKYSGAFPKHMPKRGYFKKGDGYLTLTDGEWKDEIRKIQKLTKWICRANNITVDGEYGGITEGLVTTAQRILGVKADGCFGPVTLKAAKKYRR